MQRTCSLSLSVPPHTPDVIMDHRVKPGGDAVGSVWPILRVEWRVAAIRALQKMGRKYMPLCVAEFQFPYNGRFNVDVIGTAIGEVKT
jgi:hypothetical protein